MARAAIFTSFSLFDGVRPELHQNAWLETVAGKIQRIGSGRPPACDDTVDLAGSTIIPGLIDAHVHLSSPFTIGLHPSMLLVMHDQVRRNLASCVRAGVTTVRDMGAPPGLVRRMMEWIGEGKATGPRIVRSNSFVLPPGGYPDHLPTFPLPVRLFLGGQVAERVSTPGAVRDAVQRMVGLGADWIKTAHSDRTFWMRRQDPIVFDDACFAALIDEAAKQNRPVAVHHTWVSGFRKGLDLGVDSLEHAPVDRLSDEDIRRLVDRKTAIVPTLTVTKSLLELPRLQARLQADGDSFLCPASRKQTAEFLRRCLLGSFSEKQMKTEHIADTALLTRQLPVLLDNVRRMHEAKAVIGCGTDSGGAPFSFFGQIADEIHNLVGVGLTPFEALRSATAVNAGILRMGDRLGTLEPGKLADFVALDGNPLVDPSALYRVKKVVKEGATVWPIPGGAA